MTAMPRVLMYSTAVCPFCVRAEQLLRARGVVDIEKVRIDLDPARRAEMLERTARRTVPQIYIGETHVGGSDELLALDRAGKLMPLLAGESV
ncbi:MAG: glutaredoxin 3 [Candidatus Accumulibacter phosphatis]|jgi:glutaredoxin 3|uniref:Glutaredoxin n=2 Tax=Candidatus Accumulibacter TaxID=327159 RepID=A0A080LWU5_9PROT|nr:MULTISPECIES: glutaredoxin 3 [Candidatus Accumulibacter]KFB73173.1 MAG: Glutaredoxin-3 [Candidatus Accumulibacter phosphatis]MBL8406795.1 glutaredoxin 3 [Accumulibacter sp.]HRF10777.1 glutaredoxin 3 [Candidatus Accumulibacter phosphatis]